MKLCDIIQFKAGPTMLREYREREALVGGDPEEVLAPHKEKELRNLIRKGIKDLDQDWKSAVHVVNKAYKVAGHKTPLPHMKDGWKQYEDLLAFTVGVFSNTRGPFAKWRLTPPTDTLSADDKAVERTLQKVQGYKDPELLPTNPEIANLNKKVTKKSLTDLLNV